MNRITAEPTYRLFTPGPVRIPERVAAASSWINYHHRTPGFSAVLTDMLDRMGPLFGTERPVMPVHTTGRGALEGIYQNLFGPREQVLCICNGSFGQMTAKIIRQMGCSVVPIFSDWTQGVDLAQLEKAVVDHGITAITAVHNDTSNGLVNPIEQIGALAREHGLLFVVDAVSSIGCMPFQFDRWGVDAVATASQKGLMSPPGISFVVFSRRAWQARDKTPQRASYIDFRAIEKSLQKGQTPGTTPVSLILAVNEALHMIEEEGVEQVFARHRVLAHATRHALCALGFSLFPPDGVLRSDALSVVCVPTGWNAGDIVGKMKEKYNVLIGKGLLDYADSTIRIAHMGACSLIDMLTCMTALESALCDLGYRKQVGPGVQAFLDAYNEKVT